MAELSRHAAGATQTLVQERDGDHVVSVVRRTVLPGGLRVITEAMPHVRSAAVGVWIGVGSRDEEAELAGATHYLEHLLFKGTRRRSALDISATIDGIGGEMNAFTAKEYTCYYVRAHARDVSVAIDVVCDMVTSSELSSTEVENERGVILEEIAMQDDDPSEAVHDVFARGMWANNPLGRPILGTSDSIRSLSREQIADHYRRRYRPQTMVVSVAGNVEHEEVVSRVREAVFSADDAATPVRGSTDLPDPPREPGEVPTEAAGVHVQVGQHEQAHLMLGVPGVVRTDERRFALGVLNAVLGGGMSSRLFQEIREQRGLAYAVYSFVASYTDTGMLGMYAGCQPDKLDQVVGLCRDTFLDVAANGITEAELERGKAQLRGATVLGMEDSGSRMGRLAKAELVYGELPSMDDLLARIDAVTVEDVRALGGALMAAEPTVAAIGPFDDTEKVRLALDSARGASG